MVLAFLCITIQSLPAQKLGLVLSGGGAPGIAHIGIIKALEENEIPIDYIAGTSIGAIIGGMYAVGMTPLEMIETFKSDAFKNWITGEVDWKNRYYFSNSNANPGIIELRFRVDKNFRIEFDDHFLPTNLVSPHQMNYALIPLFAQANALANSNFDSLLVPFRCVASDVYRKEAVSFKQGVLGDAIRASMTFPFLFKPIEMEDRLLFDGGIYNNFPVDVMQNDFNPNYIIGSVVAYNPPKASKKDVMMQLQNMIIHQTNYTLSKTDGLLLDFDLMKFNTFDFTKVDELVKIGYDSTMAHLAEIKARIPRRMLESELNERRRNYRCQFPELKFKQVIVAGVDSLQQQYIQRAFDYERDTLELAQFKKSYYELIADDNIAEIIPHFIFNPTDKSFDLKLNVELENELKVQLGANISSSISNQAYVGFTLQKMTNYSQTSYLDVHLGRMYNGLQVGTRIELPAQKKGYLQLACVLHKFNYFETARFIYSDEQPSNMKQVEAYSKLGIGFPIGMNGRWEMGIGYGALLDYYRQQNVEINAYNKSDYSLGKAFARIESNTLNKLMYPSKGFHYSSSIQFIGGEETFVPASSAEKISHNWDRWLQYSAHLEHYFPVTSHFTIGMLGEFVYSTRNLLQNYTSTLIQAPSFQPTPYSKTVFNPLFSANQFGAIGLVPVYNFTSQLQLRGQACWFLPVKSLLQAPDHSPYYSNPLSSSHLRAETSLVYDFKLASASVFVDYAGSSVSRWNVGVNIGILLFNPKFTD